MKFRRLCFVTGPARSGTTMLLRLLAGAQHHPNFPECGSVTSLIKLYGVQQRAEATRFDAYYGSPENIKKIFQKQIDTLLENLLRDHPTKDYLFLKDPYLVPSIDTTLQLFSTAPVLITIRNPIDVLASRKALASKRSTEFDLNNQIEALSKDMAAIRYCWHKNQASGRVHLVRFEDVIADFDFAVERLSVVLNANIAPELMPSQDIANNPFATDRSHLAVPSPQQSNSIHLFSPDERELISTNLKEASTFWARAETVTGQAHSSF